MSEPLMSEPLIDDNIRAWIGQSDPPQRIEIARRDIQKYASATGQRLSKYINGDEAPPMFLFGAFNPIVALDALGPDGLRPDSLLPELRNGSWQTAAHTRSIAACNRATSSMCNAR